MSITKKISFFLSNFGISGLVFLFWNGNVYSQDSKIADSVNIKSAYSADTSQNTICTQKLSQNFYKTDNIFSFSSPKGYFPSLLYNFGDQATAAFHIKTKQWLMTGAAIGMTSTLILIDNDIDDWARVQKQQHSWVNKSSPIITQFGGSWGVYSVASMGLLSAAFKNQKGIETSLLATQAMFTSGIWVHLIKLLTGRERPEASYVFSKSEGGKWYGPFTQYDQDLAIEKAGSSFDAFPSGHTAMAFSIATVFASQYKDKKAIPVLCYSAATLVGISRLTEHKHWASDVFVGGLIGYLCGKQVVDHFDKIHQNPVNSLTSKSINKTEIAFFQYNNQVGLSLKW